LPKRWRFRFQSNHQRGYLRRNSSIRTTGRKRKPTPAMMTVVVAPSGSPKVPDQPMIVNSRIEIGMAVKTRRAVVRRSSSRSG
jgi:hypothetical protein